MQRKIRIIYVGKNIHEGYQTLQSFYMSRIKHLASLEVTEIKDEPLTKSVNVDQVKKLETDKIISVLNQNDLNIILSVSYETITSEKFSNVLHETFNNNQKICFIVGGSHGVSNDIKKYINKTMSFGNQTMQHSLAKIVLLEQVYRGLTIIDGTKYHK